MPLLSIGVTTYDRVEMLVETLSSITAQTFTDFEVIVGNDNPDRVLTPEALGVSDPRIRFVNHPTNLGELNNMNALLALSRGRYFTWLADDDLYARNFLLVISEALEKFDYPSCVFTSFADFRGATISEAQAVKAEQFRLLTGREFIRSYLANEITVIGGMGFYASDFLKQLGGMEDVSEDGVGFYSEYMILIRAALLDRVGYVDAPLMFYRLHEGAWGQHNLNPDQHDRAGKNLVCRSIEVLSKRQLERDFRFNVKQLLKRVMLSYIDQASSSGGFRLSDLIAYFYHARKYISAPVGARYYWKAVASLIAAELWVLEVLFKRKFLSVAPPLMIKSAYSLRSIAGGKRDASGKVESPSH
jgi:glycosyltransferase involved in cell wall biosynthesis